MKRVTTASALRSLAKKIIDTVEGAAADEVYFVELDTELSQIEIEAGSEAAYQLPEIAKQLKIANELKAWELKHKYRELTPPWIHAEQIANIMKGEHQ